MRGRLIFPFLAELCRLDTAAMAGLAASGTNSRKSAYDPDFKEAVLVDADQDGVAEPLRREFPPVRTLCQIEPETLDALRMLDAGNAPRSRLLLVFHFRDLERMGFVDASTGEALIRPSGTEAWKMGKNLSRIVYQSGNAFAWAKVDLRPKPGDILYVAVPEHVCVLEKLDEDAGTISVFEYGQWDAKRQKPSGKRTVTKFSVGAKSLKVGNRTLRGWLDIARIPGSLQSPRNNVDSTLIA